MFVTSLRLPLLSSTSRTVEQRRLPLLVCVPSMNGRRTWVGDWFTEHVLQHDRRQVHAIAAAPRRGSDENSAAAIVRAPGDLNQEFRLALTAPVGTTTR